jgi:hypothetical protein
MNLSAKGGETTTDRNIFETACIGLISAITVNRHPLGIALGGTHFGVEKGIELAASAFRRPTASAGGDTRNTF